VTSDARFVLDTGILVGGDRDLGAQSIPPDTDPDSPGVSELA
jgi:hypothetical protein